VELKPSYYRQAVKNMEAVHKQEAETLPLFDQVEIAARSPSGDGGTPCGSSSSTVWSFMVTPSLSLVLRIALE